VEVRIPDSLPSMTVDKPKFTRLFELMLEDEMVSLPEGSQITISAQASVGLAQEPEIRIDVQDNGPGLSKESLRMIFDPFIVRSDSPMEYGIKLMACFFIVHHHGGMIVAQSHETKGTSFILRFPVDPNQRPIVEENQMFLEKVLLNDTMWEKMMACD